MTSPTKPLNTQSAVFSPPLHMACENGLDAIVTCLVGHHADVNAKVCVCVCVCVCSRARAHSCDMYNPGF